MRFYSNENFPLPSVDALRDLGHDVLTLQETEGAQEQLPDEDVLAFSREQGRIPLTLNRRHYIRLHVSKPDHPGIVVCTFDPDFTALAERIHAAVTEEQPLQGKLLRVNRPPFVGWVALSGRRRAAAASLGGSGPGRTRHVARRPWGRSMHWGSDSSPPRPFDSIARMSSFKLTIRAAMMATMFSSVRKWRSRSDCSRARS